MEPTTPDLMSMSPAERAVAIVEMGRRVGFDDVGIAAAEPGPEMERFTEWLERDYHGEMTYMFRHRRRRREPNRTARGVQAVIVAALDYDCDQPRSVDVEADPERGWISRYAWGEDYHDVIEPMLVDWVGQMQAAAPGFTFRHYVDHGPVLEKVFAVRAGIGWMGKHTNVINRKRGSFFFLASILTDLEVEVGSPIEDHCGSCTACLDACPTAAFPQPYVLDARRCLSYLNIEMSGPIDGDLADSVGHQLYGCDICQDVCPWNRKPIRPNREVFLPRDGAFQPRLDDVLAHDDGTFAAIFDGSPVERRGRVGLQQTAQLIRDKSGD